MSEKLYYCFIEEQKNSKKEEIAYSTKIDRCIIYQDNTGKFLDGNGNEIDIKGKRVLPDTGVYQAQHLINEVTKNGGKTLTTYEDELTVLKWPLFYKTKRPMILVTGRDIVCNEEIQSQIKQMERKNRVFFKTLEKNMAILCTTDQLINSEDPLNRVLNVNLDMQFIISSPVKILQDEHGNREYRCVIISGELQNISRFTDNWLHRIDENIVIEAQKRVKHISTISGFPNSYVMDLFEYKNEKGEIEIDVVELNPIVASGVYLYNTKYIIEPKDYTHNNIFESIGPEIMNYKTSNGTIKELSENYEGKCFSGISKLYAHSRGFAAQWTWAKMMPDKKIPSAGISLYIDYNDKYKDSQELFEDDEN